MSLRRVALSLTLAILGICLAVAGLRTAWAAGGSVTVGPDTLFHDGSNPNSSTTTITAGASVTFTWTGSLQHSVTADDGSFDSGVKGSGTFVQTFNTPGTYRYFCVIHGAAGGLGMSGVITVLAASTPTATSTTAAATSTNTPASTPTQTSTAAATVSPTATGTPATTSTAVAPSATPAVPSATVATTAAPSPTPGSAVGAGSALPSTGSGGSTGRGRMWAIWVAVGLTVAAAVVIGFGAWKRRHGGLR